MLGVWLNAGSNRQDDGGRQAGCEEEDSGKQQQHHDSGKQQQHHAYGWLALDLGSLARLGEEGGVEAPGGHTILSLSHYDKVSGSGQFEERGVFCRSAKSGQWSELDYYSLPFCYAAYRHAGRPWEVHSLPVC